MRVALVLVATAKVAAADPCVKEKEVDVRIANASAANARALLEAYLGSGYKPVVLATQVVTLKPGVAELPPWTVIDRDGKKWVVGPKVPGVVQIGPPPKIAHAARPDAVGFVRVSGAAIAFAEGRPHATSSAQLQQCECRGVIGGVVPRQPPATQTLYELPAGQRFAGKVSLAWDVEDVSARVSPCGAAP